jgi:putative spermidine/putrescine transport system ATP-binding protein
MAPLIRLEGVWKSYDGRTEAVRALDLEVARGEFLTLLGPSGSGKTTTLMMLAGFEAPSAGRILLEGRDIGALPPHRRGLGVVFQSYALFPHLTVARNVAFPLSVRGVARAEQRRRVADALALVRLTGLEDRKPAQLSGGQQQRVALARALVFDPPVVLLDEPLGALDRALREELQAELRRIHRESGVTMIYVTHDQAEAMALSDRIAVFQAGTLHQADTPRAIYDRPADAFVAGFVGENNLLPGRALAAEEDGMLQVRLDAGPDVLAQGTAAAGARVVVAIRPERVAVSDLPPADLGPGALPAQVADAVFLGEVVRLRLTLGNGGSLTVRRPAAIGGNWGPGASCAVAWQPEHAIAFPAE